jgi:hypothetical protein
MEEKPNYYAIIPADVRYDDRLKLGEKMMYGEITALSKKNGICYASNNYFAKLYNVSPQAISKWIKSLEMYKYITITYEKEGKAITKRNISMVSTCVDRVSTDIDRGINSSLEGYQQEIKDNNININNINKKEIYKEKFGEFKNVLLTPEEYQKLKDKDLLNYIDKLSLYIESKGAKYKSHYATILTWGRNDKKENNLPDWFNKEIKEEETSDEVKELLKYVNGEN